MLFRVMLRSPDDAPAGAAAPGTSAAPATPAIDAPAGSGDGATSIAAASREFLKGLTADQHNAPLRGPDDELEADDTLDALDAAATEGAVPEGAVPEAITREDGAQWNVVLGRWQFADGRMASGPAPDGATPATPATVATPASKPDASKPDAPAAGAKVVLPGLSERGETDLEVEIDDPDVAERIQRLKNDGLRRAQFDERVQQLETRESDLRAAETALDELATNPIAFTLRHMTPERQIELAKAIALEYWDKVVPEIDALGDPEVRFNALRDQRTAAEAATREAATMRQQREAGIACRQATEALIPEGTDTATRREFMRDALIVLQQAAQDRLEVSARTVPVLLERRMKLYGFGAAAPAVPPAVPKGPTSPATPARDPGSAVGSAVPSARPVNDAARAVADAAAATAAARSTQSRIRATQVQRAAATRVAPVGAGTAPVQRPIVDPKADIKQASRALRQGGLPQSWTPPAST